MSRRGKKSKRFTVIRFWICNGPLGRKTGITNIGSVKNIEVSYFTPRVYVYSQHVYTMLYEDNPKAIQIR